MGDRRDHDSRDDHEADGEHPDRPDVRAQLTQVREERGRVEERRQEDQQHDLGVELDAAVLP